MNPPFQITPNILDRISKIERTLGQFESFDQPKPQPFLRKSNRVRTIQGSLAIEGNSLNLDQVTALLEGKRVIGKQQDIQEILNAIKTYDALQAYKPFALSSLLKAHGDMMQGLILSAGKWRSAGVGIMKGSAVAHIAPPADRVHPLMKELFAFVRHGKHHPLIKSAVFHYELEFIHPFEDGNGRIGRFWHSVLLTDYHPIFEFTPVESLIKDNQQDYYRVLGEADQKGDSTGFIEFALDMVAQALEGLAKNIRPEPSTAPTRIERALAVFDDQKFSRKDYMQLFKTISSATASRDLLWGVQNNRLLKTGDKASTLYRKR